MSKKRVLSVGQCVPDNSTLSDYLARHFDVEFDTSDLPADTMTKLKAGAYDLVMINRKLDRDYSDGMAILQAIKADPAFAKTPVMLVTNFPEHQEAAVAAGAVPGIGKLDYVKPETVDRFKPYLG